LQAILSGAQEFTWYQRCQEELKQLGAVSGITYESVAHLFSPREAMVDETGCGMIKFKPECSYVQGVDCRCKQPKFKRLRRVKDRNLRSASESEFLHIINKDLAELTAEERRQDNADGASVGSTDWS